MKRVGKRVLESAGGRVLLRIQSRLSRKTQTQVEEFGARLGRIMFKVAGKRRDRALSNLAIAFPELSDGDRLQLARRVFEHFGRSSADFLASGDKGPSELDATTEICGKDNLDRALAQGQGTLLVTGHFGNWERIPAWLAYHGYDVGIVIRNADQEGVNQIVNGIRTKPGTEVIPRGDSAKKILTKLRRNGIVGIISDQNAEDAFLPFFGKLAGTNLGVGVIQERTKAAVLPTYCVYVAPGRYRIVFDPLLEPLEGYDLKGEGLLRAVNLWYEKIIREHPEQWLWFHDRWRYAREAGHL